MIHNHQCPFNDCASAKASNKPMCQLHWDLVPSWLADDVERYWEKRLVGDAIDRHNYRVARDAAVRHVHQQINPVSA